MATGIPSDQENCNNASNLSGDKEAEPKLEVVEPPRAHTNDEDYPKSSLDISLISSGSSSFEIIAASPTGSMDTPSADFDKQKVETTNESEMEKEDLEKLKDERDKQSCESSSESAEANLVVTPAGEETSRLKSVSFDESLVVLSPDDMQNSVSELKERTQDFPGQPKSSEEKLEETHGMSENKTTSEIKDDDPTDKTETKDESLGESLVVLGHGDFEDSSIPEGDTQHMTDKMIAGLVISTNILSHCEEDPNDVVKTTEIAGNSNDGESRMMKEKMEEPVREGNSDEVTDKQVSIVDISSKESAIRRRSDSTQSAKHDGDIKQQEDRKQSEHGEFDKDENSRDDRFDFTTDGKEGRENTIPSVFETDQSVSKVTDNTTPEKLDNGVPLGGSQENSLVVLEPPGEIAVTAEVSTSDISTSTSQEVQTNSNEQEIQVSEQIDKSQNEEDISKDTSLSESLVVIETDEAGNPLQEQTLERDQLGDEQKADPIERPNTQTKRLGLDPMIEERLGTNQDISPESTYQKSGESDGPTPAKLPDKVIKSIVDSMPSIQMNEQASSACHLRDVEDNKEAECYPQNNSLEGSTYSTTSSFCVLSDSMSESFLNSETEANKLQLYCVYEGADIPVIEKFGDVEEPTGGNDTERFHDINDTGNMMEKDAGSKTKNTTENVTENDTENSPELDTGSMMAESDGRYMTGKDVGCKTGNTTENVTGNCRGSMMGRHEKSTAENENMTENYTENTTEHGAGDMTDIENGYATEKDLESTTGNKNDPLDSEPKDGTQIGAQSEYDTSFDGMAKESSKFEYEEENHSLEAEDYVDERKMNDSEVNLDHQYPSLFSSTGSFEVINVKGRSISSEVLSPEVKQEPVDVIGISIDETDRLSRCPDLSTMDSDEDQPLKGNEQIDVTEARSEKQENESSGIGDPCKIYRSHDVLVQDVNRQDESDPIATATDVPASENVDDPNPSTIRTAELHHLLGNDPNQTEKTNFDQENILDSMKLADGGNRDKTHDQEEKEKKEEKEEERRNTLQMFPVNLPGSENHDEDMTVPKKYLTGQYSIECLTDATNYMYTDGEPVKTDAEVTSYVPSSVNLKNAEEHKNELAKDLTSLEGSDLLKDTHGHEMDLKAHRNVTDEQTEVYDQYDIKSDEEQVVGDFNETFNDLNSTNDLDLFNYEIHGPNILTTDQDKQQATGSATFHASLLDKRAHISRNSYNQGRVESDETGTLSLDTVTSYEDNISIEPVDPMFGLREDDDDTTLTMELPGNASHGPSEGRMDTRPGDIDENKRTTLEWYNEPVTIYVLREWCEFENQTQKVRKDQQPIVKDWITVEKVRFLFNNFRLSEVLNAKLPKDTEVLFDDVKTYMDISYRGLAFISDDEYRQWWIDTIQTVFHTVDLIHAYLCNLDNITRETTVESFKKFAYANVRITTTKNPETFLVLGTANVGSLLYQIQSLDNRHQLVKRKNMKEVRVERMPRQWNKWCRHIAEEHNLEEAGIFDIFTAEDDGQVYVTVDIHKQLDIERVIERSSQRSTAILEDGEYKLLSQSVVQRYIDDKLRDMANHWMLKGDVNSRQLIVLADTDETAEKVKISIKSSVKKIDFKKQGTDHEKKLEEISKHFREKTYWHADEAKPLINVFVTDDILEQVQRYVESLGGRKSKSMKSDTFTKNVHVDEYDQIKFVHKYMKDAILEQRNALQVDVVIQDLTPDCAVIKISGTEERTVQAAHDEIQDKLDDIKSFQHPNVEVLVPRGLIDKVLDLEMVNRCVISPCIMDTDEVEEELTFDNFTANRKKIVPIKWWTCGKARLGLVTGPVSSVETKTIIAMKPKPKQSQFKESNRTPTIFVPHHDEGKAKHDLLDSIKKVFEQLSGRGENSVAMDLQHCCNWPTQKFLKVIIQAIKEVWDPSRPLPCMMDIVMAVPTEEMFLLASDTINPVFSEPLVGLLSKKVEERLQVLVVKGDITKEETDVIVNTASKDLDLSHGAVSKALASRAGRGLQKECNKKYRKGLQYGEVAITDGHQLNCSKIFHGAFDYWPSSKRDQKQAKEVVGKFVTECLKKTEELNLSSISFPAIGTGNLRYPASVVAQEMLQRIRSFKISKPTYLKKVIIVIYPTDSSTYEKFREENIGTVDESSVDPEPESQLPMTRKQDRTQLKVYFRVTCSEADKMFLVKKIDAILSDSLPHLAPTGHDKHHHAMEDLEIEHSSRRGTNATLSDGLPRQTQTGHDKYHPSMGDLETEPLQRRGTDINSDDEAIEDFNETLKGSRSKVAALHYLNVTSDVGYCVIVRCTSLMNRTVIRDWIGRDVGVTPVGIATPYRNSVYEALVTCASSSDAGKVLRQQSVDFKATPLEEQVLFNVRASIDQRFSRYKVEIREHSGVTVDVDSSGIWQLVGNLPQIEAANEFISKILEGPRRSVGKERSSNELFVDGITKDVYNAFLFFLHHNPRYNCYKGCMNSMKYSEVDRTIRFDGGTEIGMKLKKELTQMKTDITCDQIDVEGRHFKREAVEKILDNVLKSQYDVHVSIPQDDMTSSQQMKVINLIGLDRSEVQAMKYQVLESVGMTSSRRNRRFGVPSFIASNKPKVQPILPPPPSAKEYYLGDRMTVLVYQENILYLKVDGIVNAANKNLNHGGGVAGAISDAADIQRESTDYVKKHGKVPIGTSCHTSAGNLTHYKYIIHTVGPRWEKTQQSLCEQQLQDAITSCILEADDLGLESVAIPAISAGIFSMPSALCVRQYCLGVRRAWSKLQQRSRHFLKEIHFVDKDAVILSEIQKEFDNSLENPYMETPGHAGPQSPSVHSFGMQGARPKYSSVFPYKEVTNRGGIDKTIFHLTAHGRVHVYTCNILATRVDAIVCGQDKSLQSKSKIAASVQEGELSGQDFKTKICEIKTKNKKIKTGDVFCIPIKGFDTTMLLMSVCPTYTAGVNLTSCKDGVQKCVQSILNKANEMDFRSIALPVLGSGNDTSKAGDIAKVIVESILKFFLNPQLASVLSDIHFVNQDKKVTKAIEKMFDEHVTAENTRVLQSIEPKIYPGKACRAASQPVYHHFDQGRLQDKQGSSAGELYQSRQESSPGYRDPNKQIIYPHVTYQSGQESHPGYGGSTRQMIYPGVTNQSGQESHPGYRDPTKQMIYPSVTYQSGQESHPGYGDSTGQIIYPSDHQSSDLDPPEMYQGERDQYKKEKCFTGDISQSMSSQEEDVSGQPRSDLGETEKKPVVYEDCVICIDTVTGDNVKTLPKCKHSFHPECIDAQFKHKPVCPTCGTIYGVITGNQPRSGTMKSSTRPGSLPGFEKFNQHIYISYWFPDGIQESDHPNQGQRYKGTMRVAYLPDNPQGRAVHEMLKIAFQRRLTFTIGHSRTTGEENVVTWNDIHHKTNRTGGQQNFGYPDPEYLDRVTDELAAKGVTKADIK